MSSFVVLPLKAEAVNLDRVLMVRLLPPHPGDVQPRCEAWFGGVDRRHFEGRDGRTLAEAVGLVGVEPVNGLRELSQGQAAHAATDVETGEPVG